MVRGLAAPLSERETRQLLYLLQQRGNSEIDRAACKRFVMLGLAEEKPDGFAITKLGRQRLTADQTRRG
jgi:hypothetical protein